MDTQWKTNGRRWLERGLGLFEKWRLLRLVDIQQMSWYLLNIVNFTRVGSVEWSPAIRGDTGLMKSELFLALRSIIGPEFWPGIVALSWLTLMIVHDIWTFDKVVLVSLSWVTLEVQDLWSHLFAFDVNLNLVDQQGRYTLLRELLLIFLKWTVSWLRQIEDPSTRIILLLLFLGVNTHWS